MTIQSSDSPNKVLDLALRILLVELHDEWGDDVYEPIGEAIARWSPLFAEAYSDPHYGDCTKQPITCMRCMREDYMDRAQKRISEDSR